MTGHQAVTSHRRSSGATPSADILTQRPVYNPEVPVGILHDKSNNKKQQEATRSNKKQQEATRNNTQQRTK
jgi:hypothetical protein